MQSGQLANPFLTWMFGYADARLAALNDLRRLREDVAAIYPAHEGSTYSLPTSGFVLPSNRF
jgi:glyoxylase-like metal-dependent hydrolase (beta-lactamase superfamily II)